MREASERRKAKRTSLISKQRKQRKEDGKENQLDVTKQHKHRIRDLADF